MFKQCLYRKGYNSDRITIGASRTLSQDLAAISVSYDKPKHDLPSGY